MADRAFDTSDDFDDEWILDGAPEDEDPLGESELAAELRAKEDERTQLEAAQQERLKGEQQATEEQGRVARRDVRVDVRFPMRLRIDGMGPPAPGRTRDLSATGFGFSTRFDLEKEVTGKVTLELPEWTFQKEFIVRFLKPIVAGSRVGAQFVDLTDDERDRLARVVFNVQREQLRSGG